jgi:hypothetical protein
MGAFNFIKHWTIAITTATAPNSPYNKGGPGRAAEAFRDFVADIGVSESVKQQLLGIEQVINAELVDLGPYHARAVLNTLGRKIGAANNDCSIYDAPPSMDAVKRSGALVFVGYYSDYSQVTRDPVVEFVGFGSDMESAWKESRKLPRISKNGDGQLQKEKSYMLWYQFSLGELVIGKIPYPFYLTVIEE